MEDDFHETPIKLIDDSPAELPIATFNYVKFVVQQVSKD